ncbi:hybrid-cluster NAD(P)-dependent oxidoreductase [Endozoicomonas sp. SM1973]|uniref:Hybrid-cluster NAD(P)-dependent oxidoreductase n=1 Tax=Spartinivicinus marinus TaxID=2994442 RepID=A0A853I4Q6_9GAMM|nr:hybrid-cluster NAD(P)-dependent oxidoreductase [Spartinivicinus marinus]MCX4026743.1 hybrid-cluster NAD(P)-dependent oxidoreductase [Spartinivicinus marinus]NYZ64577.1 hybrid-cluster NAD(P)-dependent oxidoreductase [Spartinivicinus marinus]
MTQTFANPATSDVWQPGSTLNVRCVAVIPETHDVMSFWFQADKPMLFHFKPGQFVTLNLTINGKPVQRCYTIVTAPSRPYCFAIAVKRVPNGYVSNWLHDNLSVGDTLDIQGPAGIFTSIDYSAEKVLLLSGGVGITPVMSMARWWADTMANVDMVFIHSARTPDDILFIEELTRLDAVMSNFKLVVICEKIEPGQSWFGYRGFLHSNILDATTPDLLEREVFCCGPGPYMAAVQQMLQEVGFDMSRYHEESFITTPEENPEDAANYVEVTYDESELITVEFAATGKTAEILPGETIHQAAGKVGLHMPRACGMGLCGTCKVLKKSGEVSMNHSGGITDEDIAEGYILSCCSVPTGDVVVDF